MEKKAKKSSVRSFICEKIMEGKLTDLAIFKLTAKKFPEWKSEKREYYVSWYRWDLNRKGVKNVPEKIVPKTKKAA